jgi:hypothetical protein
MQNPMQSVEEASESEHVPVRHLWLWTGMCHVMALPGPPLIDKYSGIQVELDLALVYICCMLVILEHATSVPCHTIRRPYQKAL